MHRTISQHRGFVHCGDQTFQLRDQRGDIRTETGFERMSPELYRDRLIPLSSQSCPGPSRMPCRPPLAVILWHRVCGLLGGSCAFFCLKKQSHVVLRDQLSGTKAWCDWRWGEGSWCLLFPFYPPPSFLPHSALSSRKTRQPKLASALTLNLLNINQSPPHLHPPGGEFPSPLFLGLSCDTDGHTDTSWLAPPLRYHRCLFSSEVINHRTLPCFSEQAAQARNAERSSRWFSSPDLL